MQSTTIPFQIIESILKMLIPFSSAFAVTASFILFIPENLASDIGLLPYKLEWLGAWWLLFIFSTTVSIFTFFRQILIILKPLYEKWCNAKHVKHKLKLEQEKLMKILERLDYLSTAEEEIIITCLKNNSPTILLPYGHSAAEQLRIKGLLSVHSQHITNMKLIYMVPDKIWHFLIADYNHFNEMN